MGVALREKNQWVAFPSSKVACAACLQRSVLRSPQHARLLRNTSEQLLVAPPHAFMLAQPKCHADLNGAGARVQESAPYHIRIQLFLLFFSTAQAAHQKLVVNSWSSSAVTLRCVLNQTFFPRVSLAF